MPACLNYWRIARLCITDPESIRANTNAANYVLLFKQRPHVLLVKFSSLFRCPCIIQKRASFYLGHNEILRFKRIYYNENFLPLKKLHHSCNQPPLNPAPLSVRFEGFLIRQWEPALLSIPRRTYLSYRTYNRKRRKHNP